MHNLLKRIDSNLRLIQEAFEDTSWKDVNSPNYDRAWAEDALYHTIGPLTENPRWTNNWTSDSEPVPGFTPGGSAPRWTREEVVIAFAGDPKLLFKAKDAPKSPQSRGGSPLFRLAKRIASKYARGKDLGFIEELYNNGYIGLLRKMQEGGDLSLSPFISYAIREVESTMVHGVGSGYGVGKGEDPKAQLAQSELQKALDSADPKVIRSIADQVQGKYQYSRSTDEDPKNPFGKYSSKVYNVLTLYAEALEANNEDRIESATSQIRQMLDSIEEESGVRGASTGIGQAISTPDRKTSIGISSLDVESGEGGDTLAGSIEDRPPSMGLVDAESIAYVLDIALNTDIGSAIGNMPKYRQMAIDFGAKMSKSGGVQIGGRLSPNEYRFILRTLGRSIGKNYPGEGVMRSNLSIPRDAIGWLEPGEDPEIEAIPSGGQWNSIWKRKGYPEMQQIEMIEEMTAEVHEFNKLGIRTARTIKSKVKSTTKGKAIEEVVSGAAIGASIRSALVKIKLIADIHKSDISMQESRLLAANGILIEGLQQIDKMIISETCKYIIDKTLSKIFF